MTARILLVCAFGVDIADEEIEYWVKGKRETRTVGVSLSQTFNDLIQRVAAPHVQLMPIFANIFITQSERDMKRNALALREFCENQIKKRREEINNNPEEA